MTTATPTTPAEFEDHLMTAYDSPAAIAAAIADRSFFDTLRGYSDALRGNAIGADLSAQVQEQVQMAIADMLGEPGAAQRLNLNVGPGNRETQVPSGRRAPGFGLNGVFPDMADFIQSTWHRAKPTPEQAGRLEKLLAYSEGDPSEGGFLIPEEFRRDIMVQALESSVVRPRATVVPLNTKSIEWPAVDETTHAGTVFGGVAVYRTEEQAELTESAASFRRIKLELTTQTALAHVPNDLIQDTGGGIVTFIMTKFGPAVAFFEDVDFQKGSGAGEPLGALRTTNPGTVSVAKESGQDADTIVWQNVVRMFARLLPTSIPNAVWVVSNDCLPELYTQGLIVGTGGGPTMIGEGQGRLAPPTSMLGIPIVVTEKTPGVLGDRGDITLIDYSYYIIGDGMRMEVTSSPHAKFTSNQTSFRMVQRNDGRPSQISPLTPENGGPTLATTVQLNTRA